MCRDVRNVGLSPPFVLRESERNRKRGIGYSLELKAKR